MDKKVIKKMTRFVELSAKFSKSERDIFTDEEIKTLNGNLSNNMGGIISGGNSMVIVHLMERYQFQVQLT